MPEEGDAQEVRQLQAPGLGQGQYRDQDAADDEGDGPVRQQEGRELITGMYTSASLGSSLLPFPVFFASLIMALRLIISPASSMTGLGLLIFIDCLKS